MAINLGSNGYGRAINVSGLPALTSNLSLSLWFNCNGSTPIHGTGLIGMINQGANLGTQTGFRDQGAGIQMYAWGYGGVMLVNRALPSLSDWHLMVYTFDGTTNRMYLDNLAAATGGTSPNSGTPNEILLGNWAGIERFTDGSIDDARIYNRVLSADEVLTLHETRGRDGIKDSLLVRLPLNEVAPAVLAG